MIAEPISRGGATYRRPRGSTSAVSASFRKAPQVLIRDLPPSASVPENRAHIRRSAVPSDSTNTKMPIVVDPGSPLRSGRDDGEYLPSSRKAPQAFIRDLPPSASVPENRAHIRRSAVPSDSTNTKMPIVVDPGSPLRSGRDDGEYLPSSRKAPQAFIRDLPPSASVPENRAHIRRSAVPSDSTNTKMPIVVDPGSPLRSGRDDGEYLPSSRKAPQAFIRDLPPSASVPENRAHIRRSAVPSDSTNTEMPIVVDPGSPLRSGRDDGEYLPSSRKAPQAFIRDLPLSANAAVGAHRDADTGRSRRSGRDDGLVPNSVH